MNWLSQFFINPGYAAAGAGLVLLPIVIHLINRYRYRRVRWAAMSFLMQSKKQNQRKLLLQQFLLLALRIGAVLGIVALVARPYFDPSQLQILRGDRSHHLVILDDSLSMQDRTGGKSAFEEGVAVVKRLAEEGARRPGTQTLTLLLLSKPAEALLTQVSLDPSFLTDLQTRLEKLRCSHQRGDVAAGLQGAMEHLRHPAASKTLHLIGDFREQDWERGTSFAAAAGELKEQGVMVHAVRTVSQPHENLGIASFRGDLHVAAIGVPMRLSCTVRNFGDKQARNVGLSVFQDDRELPLSIRFDEIPAGEERTQQFDVQFSEPGRHRLKVELPGDSLPEDNARFLAVELPEIHRVLIVNGNPGDDEGLAAADALAPVSGLTGFTPSIEDPEFLRRQPLDQFRSIHMVNVPELAADSLRALSEFVSRGGGVSWHLGPSVRTEYYNEQLYAQGAGLFPVPLSEVREFHPDATNPEPDLILENHPLFTAFQGEKNPFVSQVQVERYFATPPESELPESVRIIGRLSNRAPLFAEKTFGLGRVVASLTSCGSLWNNWPRNPSYVLFWLELEKYLLREVDASETVECGGKIVLSVDPSAYRSVVEVRTPDPQGTTRINVTAPQLSAVGDSEQNKNGDVVSWSEEFRDTDLPGIYQVVRYRLDDSTEISTLAMNVLPSEGNLKLAENGAIRTAFQEAGGVRIQSSSELDWTQGKFAGQEVRDVILLLLALLLVAEQFLAMKLSFHPAGDAPANSRSAPAMAGVSGRGEAG